MKITKWIMVLLVTVLTISMFTTMSFAISGGPQKPTGEAPYGVATKSDAKGIKLVGAFALFDYNLYQAGINTFGDVRAVVRLRKGSVIKVFYGELMNVNLDDPAAIQIALTNQLQARILKEFGYPGHVLVVKSMDDYTTIEMPWGANECAGLFTVTPTDPDCLEPCELTDPGEPGAPGEECHRPCPVTTTLEMPSKSYAVVLSDIIFSIQDAQ